MIQRIGVIGGGQLGRMFALDAKRMGFTVTVLDPTPHSPSGQVADEQIVAAYDDLAAMDVLGSKSDVITYEFENIAIESVKHLEQRVHKVSPSSEVLRITQNRLLEKQFLRDIGAPVGNFAKIDRIDDIAAAGTSVGWPAVLKTVRGGYDGKFQWLADSATPAKKAFAEAKGQQLIFEAYVPFVKELSVVATRNNHNHVESFPPAENVHEYGILVESMVPARVSEHVAREARRIAEMVGHHLKIIGTYCVEFFLTGSDELLVNEIAPRPHNSGHYSIDACATSQYEQHIRAICNLPLAQPKLLTNAVMMNILGEGKGNQLHGVGELLSESSIVLHLYGKKHAVARRKMGHFTVLCDELEAGIAKAKSGLAKISWGD